MNIIKKLLKLSKWLITGALWSYVYILCTVSLFVGIWNFNYLSASSWKVITDYWQKGGVIKTGTDFLFLFALIFLIPLWIWGWRKLYKMNILNLFLVPLNWYQKRSADNYIKSMSRIKIHNIGVSLEDDAKQDFEDKIKCREQTIKSDEKASSTIRSQIKKRLSGD